MQGNSVFLLKFFIKTANYRNNKAFALVYNEATKAVSVTLTGQRVRSTAR